MRYHLFGLFFVLGTILPGCTKITTAIYPLINCKSGGKLVLMSTSNELTGGTTNKYTCGQEFDSEGRARFEAIIISPPSKEGRDYAKNN